MLSQEESFNIQNMASNIQNLNTQILELRMRIERLEMKIDYMEKMANMSQNQQAPEGFVPPGMGRLGR